MALPTFVKARATPFYNLFLILTFPAIGQDINSVFPKPHVGSYKLYKA